jgi:hypothetical protein
MELVTYYTFKISGKKVLKGWKKIMSQREFLVTVYKEKGMFGRSKEIRVGMK